MAKMSDTELLGIVDAWRSDAQDFDRSDLSQDRAKAIDFYEGKVDFKAEPDKSSVVSHDVADTVNSVLPALMRVFMASDRAAIYEPRKPEDEEGAEQATDCINYHFMNEWDGYRVLHNSFHDGLLLRNGVIKHWWDQTKEYKTEKLTGLTEEMYEALGADDLVEEILEQRVYFVGPDGKEVEGDATKAYDADPDMESADV